MKQNKSEKIKDTINLTEREIIFLLKVYALTKDKVTFNEAWLELKDSIDKKIANCTVSIDTAIPSDLK